jgi:flagellar biosynthesis component FlhA
MVIEVPQSSRKSLVPKVLSSAAVQNLLPILLRQRAPMRDAVGILEALREAAPSPRAILFHKEYARRDFRRKVVGLLLDPSRDLSVYRVDSLERARDMVAA